MTGVGLGYDSVVSKRGQHSDNKEGERWRKENFDLCDQLSYKLEGGMGKDCRFEMLRTG